MRYSYFEQSITLGLFYSFSTYAKFSEKLLFLTLDTHPYCPEEDYLGRSKFWIWRKKSPYHQIQLIKPPPPITSPPTRNFKNSKTSTSPPLLQGQGFINERKRYLCNAVIHFSRSNVRIWIYRDIYQEVKMKYRFSLYMFKFILRNT